MESVQAIIEPNGKVKFLDKISINKPTRAIVTFISEKEEKNSTLILSENSLAKDWNNSKEDKAWKHLQREQ